MAAGLFIRKSIREMLDDLKGSILYEEPSASETARV